MKIGRASYFHFDSLDQKLLEVSNEEPIKFDWTNRWLKGHEYAFILKNIDAYCAKYGLQKFDYKNHPVSIYENPGNGIIYFVSGIGVGSDFGFPRVAQKKRYRWKKMNFTTDLPKHTPHITYVVASAMRTSQIQNQQQQSNFRMHAVIPHKDRSKEYKKPVEYILCHVRSIDNKKLSMQESKFKRCLKQNMIDFYELFAYVHNFSLNFTKS